MAAPARNSQSESFLSFADRELRLNPSLVWPFRSLVPPGVVTADRGCRDGSRCVLDLLFGKERFVCFWFRRETREEERERIDGVVGAERPSMYEMCWVSGRASWSLRGSREVRGARVR
jgi:hypothetical protein